MKQKFMPITVEALIRNAVKDYHLGFDQREHGGVLANQLAATIQNILEMPWQAGAELARRRADTRISYGAGCTWWDTVHHAGSAPAAGTAYGDQVSLPHQLYLPCCPYCRGMLYEVESPEFWMDSIRKFEASSGRAGYTKMWAWAQGRPCYRDALLLKAAWEEAGSP